MRFPVEADENGDSFEVWLVKRSFALMAPVCQMGLAITLLFLCIADPVYYLLDLWRRAVPHSWFLTWHLSMAVFFFSVLLACPQARTHAQRQRFVLAFVASVTLLFAWFGVVSWLGTGDLSMLAIAEILISAVFFLPGYLRRWSYGLQALGTGLILAWLDRSGKFVGQMQFTNLMVIATVALVMDGYMWRNAHILFTEKCRVARARQRSDEVLHNALPPRIAEELKTHHRVQARSHPAMSILFADIVGFTEFAAQRSPEQVLNTLNALFSEIDALVDLHQVEKIKTIGDAYMAVSQTRPQALAGLALSMLDAMQRFNARQGLSLAWRIGMHCGPTIAGVIGHKRFLYDVWGDAVNLASRMESGGEPGRIHASEALYLALQQAFAFEARGLVALKGKGLLPTYFLLGAKPRGEAREAP
jgi:class 3 adenylate cyclase